MKIDEVISLYKFLITCGWWGYVAVWFLLSVILGGTLIWGKDKLSIKDEFKKRFGISDVGLFGIVSGLVFCLVIAFHIDAKNRNEILIKANCLKSEFITNGYKVATDSALKRNFHCNCDTTMLAKILADHPNEFVKVTTDDGPEGIRIIDVDALEAINKYNQSHIPFLKSRVLDYMVATKKKMISYKHIRDSVNSDFDDEWIELMLSRYDTLFVPFNTPDNDAKAYGETHFVKLTHDPTSNLSRSN